MLQQPTNFTGFFLVIKVDEPNIIFHNRVVYCINHNILNDSLEIIMINNNKNLIICLNDIEYYLTFNDISSYRIGDTIYYASGFDGENEMIKDGIIISIEYQYQTILYSIQTPDNISIKMESKFLKFIEPYKYKVGSYVKIKDDNQPNGFIDGKILSIDNINKIYKIQLNNNIYRNCIFAELFYPSGYNLIKI